MEFQRKGFEQRVGVAKALAGLQTWIYVRIRLKNFGVQKFLQISDGSGSWRPLEDLGPGGASNLLVQVLEALSLPGARTGPDRPQPKACTPRLKDAKGEGFGVLIIIRATLSERLYPPSPPASIWSQAGSLSPEARAPLYMVSGALASLGVLGLGFRI